MGKAEKTPNNDPVLATNKKAFHNYTVLEQFEAGIQLTGTEVKSCRGRSIALADAFVDISGGEAFLTNAHIAGYDYGNRFNHDIRRKRRLLMHKKEILKYAQAVRLKGYSIIPLKFYLKHGLVKVSLGLCKGKSFEDKRDTLRERQDSLDARRALKGDRVD